MSSANPADPTAPICKAAITTFLVTTSLPMGLRPFGDLVIDATGGAGDSYALSFNSTNTAEIESTLRRHFGKLINNDDVLAVQAALDMTPGALNVIDLTPLHEEIIARFYARLYGDEQVIQAEKAAYQAELEYKRLGNKYDWPPACQSGQSGRNNQPGCEEVGSAKQAYENAAEAYAEVLADVHNEMVDRGELPALDALDNTQSDQRKEIAELFVTALGVFVPLSMTDLAIDVGSLGLGKIARIGKVINKLDGVGGASRIAKMSDEVADRVQGVRYKKFDGYDHIQGHPEVQRYLDNADWDDDLLRKLNDDLARKEATEFTVALNKNPVLLDSWKKLSDSPSAFRLNPVNLNQRRLIDDWGSEIATASNARKGNFGEIGADLDFNSKGYESLVQSRIDSIDSPGHNGIDGVYVKDGQYYIVEGKYTGSASLNQANPNTGLPRQMSDEWIQRPGELASTIGDRELATTILESDYKRILAKVAPDGSVSYRLIDEDGYVVRGVGGDFIP